MDWSFIGGFIVDQMLQRTADAIWDKGTGWIKGEAFPQELNDAISSALESALDNQVRGEQREVRTARAHEVLLGVRPPDLGLMSVEVGTSMTVAIGTALKVQIAAAQEHRLDILEGRSTSSWALLVDEIDCELDAPVLARDWFDQLLIEVARNRLRGGALGPLADQLDSEHARQRDALVLDAVLQLGSSLTDFGMALEALGSGLQALQSTAADAGDEQVVVAEVSDALLARSRRLLTENPLVPTVRIRRKLDSGRSLTEQLLDESESLLLLTEGGSGKSVALAETSLDLATGEHGLFGFAIHWSEVAELSRVPTPREFAKAVASGLFPESPSHAAEVHRRLTADRCVLLVDGIDEIENTQLARARQGRFLAGLREWSQGSSKIFVLAARTIAREVVDEVPAKKVAFRRLTDVDLRAVAMSRLGQDAIGDALDRIKRGQVAEDLLLVNLFLMAIATDDTPASPLDSSSIGAVLPVVVSAIAAGKWRLDENDMRTADDLVHLAARAAWNLNAGRTVWSFTHRDLVRALGEDRAAAREIEDLSNLVVGDPTSFRFLHRRVGDHLLAIHAAENLDQLVEVANDRFWDHATKLLLHDTAIAASDPRPVLDMTIKLCGSHGRAFDLGVDYVAAVAASCPSSRQDDSLEFARTLSYDICAVRPYFASRHNAMWPAYVRDIEALLARHEIPIEDLVSTSLDTNLAEQVRALLVAANLVSTDGAVECATREFVSCSRYLRRGTLRTTKLDDTFGPTGSIIKPEPDSPKEDFVTLWKDGRGTSRWVDRKPRPGWLFCHARPTMCDVDGTDVCQGGHTNPYKSAWYKPFGDRCAWISAMARDRDYVEGYLTSTDLRGLVRATKFEWSRTHALLQLITATGDQAADDFRWWWIQPDTTDAERFWLIEEIHDAIERQRVGNFLVVIDDLMEDPTGLIARHFSPAPPSVLSRSWNEFWNEGAALSASDSTYPST